MLVNYIALKRYDVQGGHGVYVGHVVRLRIRAMLEERQMTAYALAKATGLSHSTIYRLTREGGQFRRIEAETINKICRVLGCEPGALFERD